MDGTARNRARVVVRMLRSSVQSGQVRQALDGWLLSNTATIQDLENIGINAPVGDGEAVLQDVDRFKQVGGYE